MKIKEIAERLNLAVLAGSEGLDREISGGYTSDLLSDVMGNAAEGAIWITLQTHKNVMAIASLRDLAGIILVKGNKPDPDTAAQAETESIPVLGTDLSAFEISGKLYQLIF
jgi:serine kinase of HPr protein (carbohydrate metabolism regulator)